MRELWPGTRPESQNALRFEIVTSYQGLAEFSRISRRSFVATSARQLSSEISFRRSVPQWAITRFAAINKTGGQ